MRIYKNIVLYFDKISKQKLGIEIRMGAYQHHDVKQKIQLANHQNKK